MKPVYFFLGANSEEGFFSLYDQLLGGRLDDLMILKSVSIEFYLYVFDFL